MRSARTITAGLLAGIAAVPVAAPAASAAPVTVMTRNLYLGADIFRPVQAVQGKSGFDALIALGNANWETRRIVDRTSFPARSKLLAREILRTKPDLVGLQEVALWRRGPVDVGALGDPSAKRVDLDFLKILLRDLEGRYKAVHVQKESDVEAPAFPGSDLSTPEGFNARLTMRDVILKRRSRKVKVLRKGGERYEARFSVSLSGTSFDFDRGYNFADVRAGSKRLRFINTHLESARSDIALAQAQELLAGPVKGARKKPVVVVCDCNSDPLDESTKPYDIPHHSAYRALTGTLTDLWLALGPEAGPGFTSGLSELVDDPDTSGIDHRIDLILGKRVKALRGEIVGTDPENRSASGLWPSDHAGVVVRLR